MEWRTIPSLPAYEASDAGTIRCKPFATSMPNGGQRTYGGKEWRGVWDGSRYIIGYRSRTFRVARLICEAFHGIPATPDMVCSHINEDARDNRPSNLCWETQRQNLSRPMFKARRAELSGARWKAWGSLARPQATQKGERA